MFIAVTEFVGTPEEPVLGENFELKCVVRTDELLRATGTLELTLPNGTVFASTPISSPETSIVLQLNPLQEEDTIGDYACTSKLLQSPEFPGLILQQFSTLNFGMSKYETAS